MRTKPITFSGIVCFIDDTRLKKEDFTKTIQEGIFHEVSGNIVQIFQLLYDGDFLKVGFSDGSAMPRNPQVYNKEKQEFEPNPRGENQIEPKDYFAVFDLNSSYVWLSNTKKKNVLLGYFRKLFRGRELVLKDVYEEEKFVETMKTLDHIKISAAPSLFSSSHTLSQALVDEMYGAQEAILHLKYQNVFVGDTFRDKIKSLFGNKSSFNNITISGRDEKNLGMLFNNNLFSKKIDIDALVDENEMFNTNDVFAKIIGKIEQEKNESR